MLTGVCGDRVLHPDGSIGPASLGFDQGRLRLSDAAMPAALLAGGYLVLPGMVDIHGDAFERQISPRPEVSFGLVQALMDTDRQLLANGITTAFHGITWSWEGGLRGGDNARGLTGHIRSAAADLGADHRIHLRFETYNLDAVSELGQWLAEGKVDLLAFNDHMPMVQRALDNDARLRKFSDRAGLGMAEFRQLVDRIVAGRDQVPAAIAHLAGIARYHRIPMASHDDFTPQERCTGEGLGISICEFPRTRAAADQAREFGNPIILGAPNVVLGGSHCNAVDARSMIMEDRCDILASDYYYPAMLQAAFRLAEEGALPLGQTWNLVSRNPARTAGLGDRGEIADGQRADLVLVDDRDPARIRIVATIVNGCLRYATTDLPRQAHHEQHPIRNLLGAAC